jgi:hypothetical protein
MHICIWTNKKLYENNKFSITSDGLKVKLDGKVPLLLFDIRDSKRFEKRHIPGSACEYVMRNQRRVLCHVCPKI